MGRRGALIVAVLTSALSMWAGGAPSITYPVYQAAWHLSSADTTAVFATYPVALVVVLSLFRGIPDAIGGSRAIVTGLMLMSIGTFAFAVAEDISWLFAGRALTGAGVGLAYSAATASLAEYAKPGKAQQAGALSVVSTAGGLTTVTVLTGALIAHAPDPLHLSFQILLAILLAVTVAAFFLPAQRATSPWQFRWPRVEAGLGPDVVRSTIAVSTGYTGGAVILSLGAVIARNLVGTTDPLSIGAVIAISSASTGITGLLARHVGPPRAVPIGAAGMVLGFGVLIAASTIHSLALLLASMPLVGAGYGLVIAGGVGDITARAPQQLRASTLSVVFLISYAIQACTTLALGVAASLGGLRPVLLLGATAVSLLGALASIAFASRPSETPDGGCSRNHPAVSPSRADAAQDGTQEVTRSSSTSETPNIHPYSRAHWDR